MPFRMPTRRPGAANKVTAEQTSSRMTGKSPWKPKPGSTTAKARKLAGASKRRAERGMSSKS